MSEVAWIGCTAYVFVGSIIVGCASEFLQGKPVRALIVGILWPIFLGAAIGVAIRKAYE